MRYLVVAPVLPCGLPEITRFLFPSFLPMCGPCAISPILNMALGKIKAEGVKGVRGTPGISEKKKEKKKATEARFSLSFSAPTCTPGLIFRSPRKESVLFSINAAKVNSPAPNTPPFQNAITAYRVTPHNDDGDMQGTARKSRRRDPGGEGGGETRPVEHFSTCSKMSGEPDTGGRREEDHTSCNSCEKMSQSMDHGCWILAMAHLSVLAGHNVSRNCPQPSFQCFLSFPISFSFFFSLVPILSLLPIFIGFVAICICILILPTRSLSESMTPPVW